MCLDEKGFIRKKSLFAMACYDGVDDNKNVVVWVLDSPAFIKNKLAQVLVTFIYFEYPSIWSSVFVDLLPHLNKGAVVIDMFCRLLIALDDELISMDYPRNAEELDFSGRIKDAMRQQCVSQIVRAWYDIVMVYKSLDSELCTSVRFDEEELPEQLRGAADSCVLAVVMKRMDPQAKLTLLKSLQKTIFAS